MNLNGPKDKQEGTILSIPVIWDYDHELYFKNAGTTVNTPFNSRYMGL